MKTIKYSALNWIDDEAHCGYSTARVNGFAIVMCCDDHDFAIQVFDEEDDQAIESGEVYMNLKGFRSFDDMLIATDYLAYTLCYVR